MPLGAEPASEVRRGLGPTIERRGGGVAGGEADVRVLLVEDEEKMAGLRGEGISVDLAHLAEDALWMAASVTYDAILLDVMLPGIDGFEACRRLRPDPLCAQASAGPGAVAPGD